MNVLITGGASGLGEAITRRIASEAGSTVYFTWCRSAENAVTLEKELPNTVPIQCDFRDEISLEGLTNRIDGLNLDILINNAWTGSFLDSSFHKTAVEDYQTAFRENVIPAITITREAINCFRKRKSGKIITVLTSAIVGNPPIGSSVYVAAKACLLGLVKVWAAENVKHNITSTALSPSFMLTGFTKDIDERVVDQIRKAHPLGKLLTREEAAEAIACLMHASPEVNGVNVEIHSAGDIVKYL